MAIERDLGNFAKAFENMVSTNQTSGNVFGQVRNQVSDLTEEQIKTIISYDNLERKQLLSRYYFKVSGFYKRIVINFATILTFDYLLIPLLKDTKKDINKPEYSKKYYAALDFIDKMNPKIFGPRFAKQVLLDGVYFGVIVDLEKEGFTIIDLPSAYCRSRFRSINNIDVVEFNLMYFDTIINEDEKNITLDGFPKEVKKAYWKYKRGLSLDNWYMLNTDSSIYFNLFNNEPFFLDACAAIESLESYKVLEKQKDIQELRKILVQQIKIDGQELVFEPDEAAKMHSASVGMLKGNKGIDVLTTYNDIQLLDMVDKKDSSVQSNLDKIKRLIYNGAGVSEGLFGSSGDLSIDKSINNDISLMMTFANSFANLYQRILNRKFGNKKLEFSFQILPISEYNKSEYLNDVYKTASNGYSLSLPYIVNGISQRDFEHLKNLENNLLNLPDILIPFKSSFNSGDKEEGVGSDKDKSIGGAPEKELEDKSPKTIKNIKAKGNATEKESNAGKGGV